MTIFVQGMRRSGTTICYDAFCQDPVLTCWYEPLAAAQAPAIGGGSGTQDVDLFSTLRPEREAFAAERGIAYESLNYGAPRDARLEFEETLPRDVRDWIVRLIDRPGPVMAKFTRMYRKVGRSRRSLRRRPSSTSSATPARSPHHTCSGSGRRTATSSARPRRSSSGGPGRRRGPAGLCRT